MSNSTSVPGMTNGGEESATDRPASHRVPAELICAGSGLSGRVRSRGDLAGADAATLVVTMGGGAVAQGHLVMLVNGVPAVGTDSSIDGHLLHLSQVAVGRDIWRPQEGHGLSTRVLAAEV